MMEKINLLQTVLVSNFLPESLQFCAAHVWNCFPPLRGGATSAPLVGRCMSRKCRHGCVGCSVRFRSDLYLREGDCWLHVSDPCLSRCHGFQSTERHKRGLQRAIEDDNGERVAVFRWAAPVSRYGVTKCSMFSAFLRSWRSMRTCPSEWKSLMKVIWRKTNGWKTAPMC